MVIVSGAIGVHGIAIMSVREGLEFGTVIASDTAPLNGLVATMLAVTPEHPCPARPDARAGVVAQRDRRVRRGHHVRGAQLPVPLDVQAVRDILGMDPVYIANEGKLVAMVPPEQAEAVLRPCRPIRWGRVRR
ncbi:MAG: hypothetical protein R3A10_01310 [Caldilineaceae bacterium]